MTDTQPGNTSLERLRAFLDGLDATEGVSIRETKADRSILDLVIGEVQVNEDPETTVTHEITYADLRALEMTVMDQPEQVVERMERLIGAHNERHSRQVGNQNRLLGRLGDIRRIIKGGGTDSTKVIEIKKIV